VLAECESVADAKRRCLQLPESFRSRSGQTVKTRAAALRLVAAYERIEDAFLAEIWPKHEIVIRQARERIEAELLSKQDEVFTYVIESLAMRDPRQAIPLYLVSDAPSPGGFTHRYRGGGVCFVGVDGASGSMLHETVIHESIHALDIATDEQETALQVLRKRLREKGFGPRSQAYRDVPHTVIFVQAAETVKRLLDPQHKHYGDVSGYYENVPEATRAVRENWEAHLHGKLPLERAIGQIVDATIRLFEK
jgi:hypothetical protein